MFRHGICNATKACGCSVKTNLRRAKVANNKGLQQFLVSCVGISPMLQNPMTDDTLDELIYGSAGKRKPPERDVPLESLAKKKLCLGPNGEFGIPANYLFASLVDSGRHVIYDKRVKLSTRDSSLVPALLAIIPDLVDAKGDGFIAFKDQDAKWIVDRRRGVLAANKAAVAVVRPKFTTWAFDVTVEIDMDQVAIEKIKDLFNCAGRLSGLGDFRPSKRGQFGRFKVVDFAEMAQKSIAQAA